MGVAKLYNPLTSQWELSTGAVASDVQSVNGFTGAVLLDAAKVGAVDVAKVGNLLTDNQASGTDTLGDTTGFNVTGGNSSVATAPSGGHTGTRCVTCTATSTASCLWRVGGTSSSTDIPVVAGRSYTFQFWARADSISRAAYARIQWSTGPLTNSTFVILSTSWQLVTVTGVAPAGATSALGMGYITSPQAGETWQVDTLGFWAGAGGQWAMPGTPITGLGTRVTHPNVDDVLVQRWDEGLGRWQTVHYDSGMRDFAGLLLNGWTGTVRVRRLGFSVFLDVSGVSHPTAPVNIFLAALPTGFLPNGTPIMSYRNGSSGAITHGRWGQADSALPAAGQNIAGHAGAYLSLSSHAIPTSLPGTLVSAAPA